MLHEPIRVVRRQGTFQRAATATGIARTARSLG